MRTLRLLARGAAVLASLLAIGAAFSAAFSLPAAVAVDFEAEMWRVVGLFTWAALFLLLARSPHLVALWLIALASKVSLVAIALVVGLDSPGMAEVALWDGALSLLLVIGAVAATRSRSHEVRTAPAGG